MSELGTAPLFRTVVLGIPRHPELGRLYCATAERRAIVAEFDNEEDLGRFWSEVVVPATTNEPGLPYRFERVAVGPGGTGWTTGSRRYGQEAIEHEAFKTFPGAGELANGLVGLPGERVVAFVDILGFAGAVRRMASEDTALFEQLRGALHGIRRHEDFVRAPFIQSFADMEMTAFSDSIVISAEGPAAAVSVIEKTRQLSAELLRAGVLTRGGVASGWTYHHEGVVLGVGMLEAYDLERRVAYYPRVVISPQVAETVESQRPNLGVNRAPDGCWYLDPFSDPTFSEFDIQRASSSKGLAGFLSGFTGLAEAESFRQVRSGIARGLEEVGGQPRHLAKWHWMASEFNAAIAGRRGLEGLEPIPLPE